MDDNSKRVTQLATISFDLEEPDAERKLKKMLNVDDYIGALDDFNSEVLRKYFKYGEGEKVRFKPRGEDKYKEIIPDYDTMEYIEDAFWSLMGKYQINFDKLIY